MTKKMDEFFNLAPVEGSIPEIDGGYDSFSSTDLVESTGEVISSLTTNEKVDMALPTVTGLDMHDSEMDEIAQKAISTYQDLMTLGGNVPDMHAGKIFEVAGQMLKTALEAKNSKAEKKLRMIELQLKKIRAEQIDFEQGNGSQGTPSGGEFDRNQLLKYLVSNKNDQTDK